MLFFNDLLKNAGISPSSVLLVRHQDGRGARGRTPYAMWKSDRDAFELYQSMQTKMRFRPHSILATFSVPPTKETLFLGLYSIGDVAPSTSEMICPLRGVSFPANSINVYEFRRNAALQELSERLVIEWGGSHIQWTQYAENQNKPIVELRRAIEHPPVPKFRHIRISSEDLWSLPPSWQSALSSVGGVYLLVSDIDGAQYVGSATGAEGFLARWRAYAENGDGGNKLLRERGKPPYTLSILETVGDAALREEVIALENFWKEKLGSRAHGLNAN